MKKFIVTIIVVYVFLLFAACASAPQTDPEPIDVSITDFKQWGKATQELRVDGLSIAHPALVINSKVYVTNTQNGKTTEVTVVSHIPASSNRIADVSPDVWEILELTSDTDILISATRPVVDPIFTGDGIASFIQWGKATRELRVDGLSIAHSVLPVGSKVYVVNRRNGKVVEATIISRIPASASRIADLSQDVWQALELTSSTEIIISVIPISRPRPPEEEQPELTFSGFNQRGKATQESRDAGLSITHSSLPINSKVNVTNTQTGKTIEVTIIGRIPASLSRIADVSPGVWQALELTPDTDIIISVAPPGDTNSTGGMNFSQRGRATQESRDAGLSILHPSLSINSRVNVTNTRNGKVVEAIVIGRITASSSRIADLSQDVWQALELTPDTDIIISTVPASRPRPPEAVQPGLEAPDGMVLIPAGTFTMGSPANEPDRGGYYGDIDETQHQVTLSSFYMGKYEVTQAEYQQVMRTNPSSFKGDTLPVDTVSWYDALVFCNKLSIMQGLNPAYRINGSTDPDTWGAVPTRSNATWDSVQIVAGSNGYRLPTEAQWEYACRAGTVTPFNTGNNITTGQANYDGNYPYNNNAWGEFREKTTPVGNFAPNAWGLYDMHGNVDEWCWDRYGAYQSQSQTDPTGAVSGSSRVQRGGAWYYDGLYLRSADRGYSDPSARSNYYGFRLVRPL